MSSIFKFRPVSFSWVAFNPKPKGIIVFIGGIFFGSIPTIFYNYLLKQLFLQGYTIIALPFRFSFSHWSVALSLLKEQQVLRQKIIDILKDSGFQYKDYEVYLKNENYLWLGHSLGCKYIALLEFLADWRRNPDGTRDLMKHCLNNSEEQINDIEQQIQDIDISLKNQYSILLAPEISDTQAAIRVPLLPKLIDSFGLGVQPSEEQTFKLIKSSPLFNLTGMISFNRDTTISGSKKDPIIRRQDGSIDTRTKTVPWLIEVQPKILHEEIEGSHLRPLGLQLGNKIFGPIATPPEKLVPIILDILGKLKVRH